MSHKHKGGLPYCQNCHYPLAEMDKFCPNCGQQNTDGHVSMHDLWHELSHYFTHVDNKVFITIKDLFIPGKLTQEFFKGHRKRYLHPVNLFFVVGLILPIIMSQMFKEIKTGNNNSTKTKQIYRNDLLFEMDSMVKKDSSYFTKETRPLVESFLLSNYQRSNVYEQQDKTPDSSRYQFYAVLDKIKDAKTAVSLLTDAMQVDKDFKDKPLISKQLVDYENHLLKLKYDSIKILTTYAQYKKKTLVDAESDLKMGYFGYTTGRNLASKAVDIKPLTLDSVLSYPADYDPIQRRLDSINKFIKRDSMNIAFITGKEMRISKLDMELLSVSEIVEKYNITGFWSKIAVKQFVKFGKQGGTSLFSTYANASVWLTIFTILPSAWFLLLLYRHQKRLYVEHVVFLLHYNCVVFIIDALMLFKSDWSLYGTMLLSFIFLVFAFKRFYNQNWGKTILKSVIYYIANSVIGITISLIGFALSALFM